MLRGSKGSGKAIIYKWNQMWQIEFNVEKHYAIKFGKSRMKPDCEYELGTDRLLKSEKEKIWE